MNGIIIHGLQHHVEVPVCAWDVGGRMAMMKGSGARYVEQGLAMTVSTRACEITTPKLHYG